MIYQWKQGSHHRVKPDVAAKVLNELAEAGTLNPETLVEISKSKKSPMHPEFDWVDSVAAKNWRLYQARHVINTLIVVDEETDKEPVRAFFKIETFNKNNYESTHVLIQSETGRAALINQAAKELMTYKFKYNTVLKWTGAEQEINDAIETIRNGESA